MFPERGKRSFLSVFVLITEAKITALLQLFTIDLVTVFDAILTSRQTREKLQ